MRARSRRRRRRARAADSLDRLLPREIEGAHRHGAGARRAARRRGAGRHGRARSTLPGVGRKTANVVLGHALGVPGLPVDRHVLRVANRIGIAESDDPEVVEAAAVRGAAARALDPDLGHPDSARPPDLQAEAALRSVRGSGRLRLLSRSRAGARCAGDRQETCRRNKGSTGTRPDPGKGQERPPRGGTPPLMDRAQFERLVADALASIPHRFRDAMTNLVIVVEDEPERELLREMEIEPPDTLFGLYQGTRRQRASASAPSTPHRAPPATPAACFASASSARENTGWRFCPAKAFRSPATRWTSAPDWTAPWKSRCPRRRISSRQSR